MPRLSADRVCRRRLGPAWRAEGRAPAAPLAFWRHAGNADQLCALDEAAFLLGLRPGMALADARAMHPGLEPLPEDAEADGRLLNGLADWCDRYTPLVSLDGADGLFLDISGCAHLFGGERALLDDLLARLFHQGFEAGAAIAATAGAAHAAARHAAGALVEEGEEADLLAPLPLAALRIPPEACAGLASVGLKTVGALAAAPRAPVTRRFGAAPLAGLDRALGRLDEPLSPRLPLPLVAAERRLAEPLSQADDIARLVRMLARSALPELERRGLGARLAELALFRVDGMVSRLVVGASRPLRAPETLGRLFDERLAALAGGIDAGFGFDMARLSILETAPFAERQGDLSGQDEGAEEAFAALADRIRARLGPTALLEPEFHDSRLAEQAAPLVPFASARPPSLSSGDDTTAPQSPPAVPLRLFRPPEPVDVVAAVPDGPPLRFRWRRALHAVSRAEGPERIAPEWWRDTDGETRDFYRVEDAEGRRFWLCREGDYDAGAPRWTVRGVFA